MYSMPKFPNCRALQQVTESYEMHCKKSANGRTVFLNQGQTQNQICLSFSARFPVLGTGCIFKGLLIGSLRSTHFLRLAVGLDLKQNSLSTFHFIVESNQAISVVLVLLLFETG